MAKNPYQVLNLSPSELTAESLELAYRRERISLENQTKNLPRKDVLEPFADLELAFQTLLDALEADDASPLSSSLLPKQTKQPTTPSLEKSYIASAIRDPNQKEKLENIIKVQSNLSGRLFQTLRETAGVSVDEVSKSIKVSTQYLLALENEEYEKLPAPVYVKGFLSSYLKFLGLDPSPFIEPLMGSLRSKK